MHACLLAYMLTCLRALENIARCKPCESVVQYQQALQNIQSPPEKPQEPPAGPRKSQQAPERCRRAQETRRGLPEAQKAQKTPESRRRPAGGRPGRPRNLQHNQIKTPCRHGLFRCLLAHMLTGQQANLENANPTVQFSCSISAGPSEH